MSDTSGSKENPTGTVAPRPQAGIAGQVQAVLDGMNLFHSGKTAEISALLWKADCEHKQTKLDLEHIRAEYQRVDGEKQALCEALEEACDRLEREENFSKDRLAGARLRGVLESLKKSAATQPTSTSTPSVSSHD